MPKEPHDHLALSRQLCFTVHSTALAITRAYKPLLDAIGLTYPQYLVMLVLWAEDGTTVSGIGAELRLDSGTLTPLLKRMEAAGLLNRQRDPKDERQVRLYLTDAGHALKHQAQSIPLNFGKATGLPLKRMQALQIELRSIRDALDQAVGK